MKKRNRGIVILVCLILLMAGTITATATEEKGSLTKVEDKQGITLQHVTVSTVDARLSISSGKATAVTHMTAKSSTSITSASATIQIINKSTGKTKTYRGTIT